MNFDSVPEFEKKVVNNWYSRQIKWRKPANQLKEKLNLTFS
ncbi:hypothetical protein [Caldanaerobacter sp.]